MPSKTPDSPKYGEAKERLELLLDELESNEVDIDDLADRIKEARDLIRLLTDKLARTRGEVQKVMADFEPEDDAGAPESSSKGEAPESSSKGEPGQASEATDELPF